MRFISRQTLVALTLWVPAL